MRPHRNNNRRFKRRKYSGWGMNLYRNTEEGILAGVCSGLGDHFEVDHWVMRLISVYRSVCNPCLYFLLGNVGTTPAGLFGGIHGI